MGWYSENPVPQEGDIWLATSYENELQPIAVKGQFGKADFPQFTVETYDRGYSSINVKYDILIYRDGKRWDGA